MAARKWTHFHFAQEHVCLAGVDMNPTCECVRTAVVALVEGVDNILTVWNRRYDTRAFPGGLVEPGEDLMAALMRELEEEVGVRVQSAYPIWWGIPTNLRPGRGGQVVVFRAEVSGEPRAMEDGCPIEWMTVREFLEKSDFRDFYQPMFSHLAEVMKERDL